MSVFSDLNHIIIGYPPGTCGNFVSRVIAGVRHNTFKSIPLTALGSAHNSPNPKAIVKIWQSAE